MKNKKVIVIGLDGASPEIFFDKWKEELPHVKKLIERGIHGKLKSSIPPVTGPAWSSFATGCNPGKHGIFDFLYLDPESKKIRPINSTNIKAPTIYEILKEKGMKSVLINLPVSYPPKTDDIILTSLLTQGSETIFPTYLKSEIPELSRYRIFPEPQYYVKFDKKKFIEDITELEKDKFEIAKKLFKKEWNFFFILFSGTDWIQHKFYSSMKKKPKKKNKLIIDFYKQLDSYIGWFLENKEPNTPLFIISDHGFDVYEGIVGINNLLEKHGYLVFKEKEEKEVIPSRRLKEIAKKRENSKTLSINPTLGKLLTKNKWLTQFLKTVYNLLFSKKISINTTPQGFIEDLERSQAYSLSGSSGIFIKKAYQNKKQEIIKALKQEKAISEIKEGNEVYHGPYTDQGPDLVLMTEKYIPNKKQFQPVIKKTTTGHQFDGIYLADIPSLKNPRYENRDITDIVPTILKILNIDSKTSHMDGENLL